SRSGTFELSGLHRSLPIALHEAYITKIGQLNPLKIIADSLEPYLKKVALIANLDNANSILSKQLMPLLKLLNLNNDLTTQISGNYPQLTEIEMPNYAGSVEYLEYICSSYLTRNKVHESPDWNRKIVIEKLTHLLIVYIYTAFKYKLAIQNTQDSIPQTGVSEKIGDEQKYLYYFISFGSTTNQIRNQVITSYTLNALQEKTSLTTEQIKETTNSFFSADLNINYYQTLLQRLLKENKVDYDKENKQYRLSADEKIRLNSVQKNFEENKKIFFLFLEDIARKYQIIHSITDLFDKLQEFIENNYKIDVAEAYDKGAGIKTDENQSYHSFIVFLQSLLPVQFSATDLFRDLIELSRDSDFLLRMCASKAFANLTNPERFEQYIHQQERVVYLDTQIILYVLCLNYVKKPEYKSIYYQTAEELIELVEKNPNIKLKVSRLYLQEVAHQLKLALLLIPFEEIATGNISSNVFFQFYWHLKENDLLEAEDNTFADFMASWLHLYEEDAYDPKFHTIAYSNLYDILGQSDLNVEVETLPQYENKNEAVDVLNTVLDEDNSKFRPKHSIDNDTLMMCHLCNGDLHTVEPFFLTWDKMFSKFRKSYLEKYKRGNTISFHLFNPARFLNHYSLINIKINTKALTDDFLSIMDSNNVHKKTQTIWDSINKFLSIDTLDSLQRRRYVKRIKGLFESELDYTADDFNDVEKANKIIQPFEEILSKINEHFTHHSSFKITDYRDLLLAEEYFDKVSSMIFADVAGENASNISIVFEIENLIDSNKKEKSLV
ncbi:MAG TPA: hypothetical protein VK588_12855, partial [Chitinophagaceae bacterium]|nr:hypothetical protein [Chitinophagaceae bacterium]